MHNRFSSIFRVARNKPHYCGLGRKNSCCFHPKFLSFKIKRKPCPTFLIGPAHTYCLEELTLLKRFRWNILIEWSIGDK